MSNRLVFSRRRFSLTCLIEGKCGSVPYFCSLMAHFFREGRGLIPCLKSSLHLPDCCLIVTAAKEVVASPCTGTISSVTSLVTWSIPSRAFLIPQRLHQTGPVFSASGPIGSFLWLPALFRIRSVLLSYSKAGHFPWKSCLFCSE